MSGYLDHFIELKRRVVIALIALVVAACGCYLIASDLLRFLIAPLADQGATRLIYTDLTEAFFTYLKVAAVAGFGVASPVIFGQLWLFIAPALYQHERKRFLPFFLASPILFSAGAALVYYFVMPMAWHFFLQFQTSAAETVLPIEIEARVSTYLNLVLSFLFAFGLCFQLPIALILMGRAGLITRNGMASVRRYVILGAFIVAAVLTPPDIISQCLLALPILLLFEISLWFLPNDPKPAVPDTSE